MKRTLIALTLFALCGNAVADPLSAWNNTAAKRAIEEWVQGATNPDRSTFIPAENATSYLIMMGPCGTEAPLTFQIRFVLDEIKRLAPQHQGGLATRWCRPC